MSRILTTCTYSGCGCGLYIETSNGKIRGIYPSSSHPVNQGKLCIRGWKCYEFVESENRLNTPLIKQEAAVSGQGLEFKEVSWDNAINITASKLKEIKEKYGPDAIGVIASCKITNEENYLLQKFARCALFTNNIDSSYRLYHAPTLIAFNSVFGLPYSPNSISCIGKAEVIFSIGQNAAATHPQVASYIMKAKQKGLTIIAVNPVKTKLIKFADMHLKIKPGTDLALLLSLCNVVINEKLYNESVVKKYSNFENLKKSTEKYTPEYVEKITGISAEDIKKSAKIIASKKTLAIYSTGLTQHTNGTDNIFALINLFLLTGNIGKEGSGILSLIEQNNGQGAIDMGCLPDYLPGYVPLSEKEKFEKLWGVKIPDNKGKTLTEMISAIDEGKIKALYIVGENPLMTLPDINYVRSVFSKLEFLVVQDIFLTETAKLANVVLPAASFAEKDGTFTSLERRVQRIRKAIEPPGNALSDSKIISLLSDKFGYKMEENPQMIFEEIANNVELYKGITYNDLEKLGGIQIKGDVLYRNGFSKSIEFKVVEYTPKETLDNEYSYTLAVGRIQQHWAGGSMTSNSHTLSREVPTCYVLINKQDAESLKIKDGNKVKVKTKKGELILPCSISEDILEKTLFIPVHFSQTPANVLTDFVLDDISKIPAYKTVAAKIEKI